LKSKQGFVPGFFCLLRLGKDHATQRPDIFAASTLSLIFFRQHNIASALVALLLVFYFYIYGANVFIFAEYLHSRDQQRDGVTP
jgi:hypothetical protein